MPVYRTRGTLTGTIEPENVRLAQEYLLYDHDRKPINMHHYLDAPLKENVELLEWTLEGDGHRYYVTAITKEPLTDDELKQLSSEVSGQNSDGLGEGFEQQNFAEIHDEGEENCSQCGGDGTVLELEGPEEDGGLADIDCPSCDGQGYYEHDDYSMISFDWQTNELKFERIA